MAGKRIVLFSDGTGNSSAKLFKTNVWRLYQALDLTRPDQIAYYDDGVGTSSFKPYALLGGALGVGLARNVKDIYAFLCRHYNKDVVSGQRIGRAAGQPNDEIYGFGFSRGAFTMRVVTGLIDSQGVINDWKDEADLQRRVAAAYRAYRRSYEPNSWMRHVVNLVRNLRDLGVSAWNRLRRRDDYSSANNPRVQIELLGLWDTVDAYGLPIEEMTRAWDDYIWPLSMRDRTLRDCVRRARHVLSLDDERNTFHPVLWDDSANGDAVGSAKTVDELRLAQVWFSGVHSNVGGGYANDKLSHVSLSWMLDRIDRAQRGDFGLRLLDDEVKRLKEAADAHGPIYDSRKGFSGYYRYQPRRFDLLARPPPPSMAGAVVAAGKMAVDRMRARQGAPPAVEAKSSIDQIPSLALPLVHHSVFDRIRAGTDGYAPLTLPGDYRVVAGDGAIASFGAHSYESKAGAATRESRQVDVFNWVWLRRVVYFLTVAATVWLAAMPFFFAIEKTGGDDKSQLSILSRIPEILSGFLPSLLKPWFDAYAAHPWWFVCSAGLALGLLYLGAFLAGTIRDRMAQVWRDPDKAEQPGFRTKWLNTLVGRTRASMIYKESLRWLKESVAPAFFFVLFVALALAGLARLWFALGVTPGQCAETPAAEMQKFGVSDVLAAKNDFDVAYTCWASGVWLEGGRRYELTVSIEPLPSLPGLERFAGKRVFVDRRTRADVFGLSDDQTHLSRGQRVRAWFVYTIGLVLRRDISEPWFAPYVKIGASGRDNQLLVPKEPPPRHPDERTRLVAEFTARLNGELFLYVNDAVDFLWFHNFYGNNRGRAKVSVKRLDWDPNYSKH